MAQQKPLVLIDGKISQLPNGDKVPGISTIGLCDIAVFTAGLFEAYLVNGNNEILTDQHGFPLGEYFPMMPKQCVLEYDNGLSDQFGKFIFGSEGEILI